MLNGLTDMRVALSACPLSISCIPTTPRRAHSGQGTGARTAVDYQLLETGLYHRSGCSYKVANRVGGVHDVGQVKFLRPHTVPRRWTGLDRGGTHSPVLDPEFGFAVEPYQPSFQSKTQKAREAINGLIGCEHKALYLLAAPGE